MPESTENKGTIDKGDADSPSPRIVNKFHTKSDLDSSQQAQHHTLGTKKDQSSPGSHNHDGKNSVKLLAGVTLTGAKAGNAAVASIVAVLVTLGATDATT